MICIDIYIAYDPKRFKNDLKRSKMIKNDQIWSNMVIFRKNGAHKVDF